MHHDWWRDSLRSSCCLKFLNRFRFPWNLLLLYIIIAWTLRRRCGGINYFRGGFYRAFKLFLRLLRIMLSQNIRYLFGRSLANHWVVNSSILLIPTAWEFLSCARITIPWAASLVQITRSSPMTKSLFPTFLVTSTSASSMTISRGSILLWTASVCCNRSHWNVTTKVRCTWILNVMYVFLESISDLCLMASNSCRMSWLPLIPAIWPWLMNVTLVDHLRGNLLIVMVVLLLLLSVAVVPFYFGRCQPLQVCYTRI